MSVVLIDPLQDPRWADFVDRHPSGCVFHSRQWLEALRRTYGYQSCAYATVGRNQELTGAIVFCTVKSWLTGSRLISLPFSDHCQPLVTSEDDLRLIFSTLENLLRDNKRTYVELRPLVASGSSFGPGTSFTRSKEFYLHQLDLRPDLNAIFRGSHQSSVQRRIRHAQREGVGYEEGRSEEILRKFYQLLLLTRRRHGLPPQPLTWFRNLIEAFREHLSIHLASKNGIPVASILTLRHKDTLVYKYGCSDPSFNNLGATPFLFWNAIQQAKEKALERLDLGRSDRDNSGLVTFKDRWGAARSDLFYYSYPARGSYAPWKLSVMRHVVERLPDPLLSMTGNLLYRHIG
jgi:CelD/BcsL family acetyltransferase involved in cellulose biosynthesis